MRYERILLAAAQELWAIQEEKLDAIVTFLALQAAGEKFSAEQIEARIGKQAERETARQDGDIALLPLKGVIANRINLLGAISGGTSNEAFGKAFDAAIADPRIKAIVLDVDSPGGAVPGTDELSAKIFGARGTKPIIAHVNSNAASAAYWIASAADEIVLNPSADVGSIGVLAIHDDVSAALEKSGIKKTLIKAGPYKAESFPFAPLTDEARAHLQSRVDHHYGAFIKRVAANRGVTQAAVREGFGQGRMVMAQAAIAEKMADSIATLDETLARFGADPAPRGRSGANRKRALAIAEAE